jgi:hypothetical protein
VRKETGKYYTEDKKPPLKINDNVIRNPKIIANPVLNSRKNEQ